MKLLKRRLTKTENQNQKRKVLRQRSQVMMVKVTRIKRMRKVVKMKLRRSWPKKLERDINTCLSLNLTIKLEIQSKSTGL